MASMENLELYFRRLAPLIAREQFLEKEMLESDVHHLEVRTGYFDKLAVLAAGSLAVAISFITAGFQRQSLQDAIHQHLCWLIIALIFILASLIVCVIHNEFISRAVFLLSEQLVSVYNAAHEKAKWFELNPGVASSLSMVPDSDTRAKIAVHEAESDRTRLKKQRVVLQTEILGNCAVASLILGYIVGITAVISILMTVKN